MNRKDALRVLGLEHSVVPLTPEIVVTAFRNRWKHYHPDAVREANADSRATDEADEIMARLPEAKKVLLARLQDEDSACKLCQGRGRLPSGMGWRTCVACKGAGVRQ